MTASEFHWKDDNYKKFADRYEFAEAYKDHCVNAKDKLIKWLDDECPHATMTNDLSYDFAELLRIKLDKLLKK